MWTLMMALPMKVAEKKVRKGIFRLPQVIPARSNKGLGTEASKRIVTKACFSMMVKMSNLTLYNKESSLALFFLISSISSNCFLASISSSVSEPLLLRITSVY